MTVTSAPSRLSFSLHGSNLKRLPTLHAVAPLSHFLPALRSLSSPPPAHPQPVQAVTNSSTQGAASQVATGTPTRPPPPGPRNWCPAGQESLRAFAHFLPPCLFLHTAPPPPPPPLSSPVIRCVRYKQFNTKSIYLAGPGYCQRTAAI
jgi:hypothetical protein